MKVPCPNAILKGYDYFEDFWTNQDFHKTIGTILILAYLGNLGLIFLNNHGWLPASIGMYIQDSYFDSLRIVFNLLLFFEVISLLFVLPRSFSGSLVKQFEILSLILLRHAFDYIQFIMNDEITWQNSKESLLEMMSNALGALFIFGVLQVTKQLQKHRDITKNSFSKMRFICWKKTVSVILLFLFAYLAIDDAVIFFTGGNSFQFFKTFYTLLIFADIFIVLVSLRYSQSYIVLFRNSGFAFATVLLRIALTSPVYMNALIGAASITFTLILTYLYNRSKIHEQEQLKIN